MAKPNEKEIPIALLALNLTGVSWFLHWTDQVAEECQLYGCLYEFCTGKKEDIDFDGAIFRTINQMLVNVLESLKRDWPLEFHERLHEIFNLVVYVLLQSLSCAYSTHSSSPGSSSTQSEDIETSANIVFNFDLFLINLLWSLLEITWIW